MVTLFDPLSQALLAQSASPEARQTQQLDELFRTISAESSPTEAQDTKPLSMPFPGMAVRDAPPPRASGQPSTQAQTADSRFLDGGPQSTSTKRQDRLGPQDNPMIGRTPSAAPKSGMIQPPAAPTATPDFNPTIGERLTNFGNALTGQGTVTNFAEQQRQRQSTYRMLKGLGFDDDSSKAATLNPNILKSLLDTKYGKVGSGSFGKQVVWGYDEEGNWVPLQVSSQGIGARTQLPPGVRAVPPGDVAQQKSFGVEAGKIQADKPAAQARLDDAFSKAETSIQMARDLASHSGLDAAVGPISSKLLTVSKDTANFETDLETLKTRLFVAAITSMRELSKTGGALGSVTEREIAKMENSFRNLDLRQGEKNMRDNLGRIAKDFEDSMGRIQQAYEQQYGGRQAPVRVQTPEEAWKLPSGTPFITPDGREKVRP